MNTPLRTHKQVREWLAGKSWRVRMLVMGGGACCSNPNPQPYDSGDGNPTIKCMNCGA